MELNYQYLTKCAMTALTTIVIAGASGYVGFNENRWSKAEQAFAVIGGQNVSQEERIKLIEAQMKRIEDKLDKIIEYEREHHYSTLKK